MGNIQKVLKKVSKTEHLSGIHSALVAACAGTDISSSELSDALDINKKTAMKAKQKRQKFDEDPKSKLLTPPWADKGEAIPRDRGISQEVHCRQHSCIQFNQECQKEEKEGSDRDTSQALED